MVRIWNIRHICIFAIFISPLVYSGIVNIMNIEIMCFPYIEGLNSAISMKVGDR